MKLSTLNNRMQKTMVNGKLPAWAIAYRKTRGTFGTGNWGIDLVNETGHSYQWWEMLKRINGVLVLNSYGYSSSTRKHINKTRSILKSLHISFIEVFAPRGLQDLESAKYQALRLYGDAVIQKKYARFKYKYSLQVANRNLKACSRIGIKVYMMELSRAVKAAEDRRVQKNIQAKIIKQHRFERRMAQTPTIQVEVFLD